MAKGMPLVAQMPKDQTAGQFFQQFGYGSFSAQTFAAQFSAAHYQLFGITDDEGVMIAACLLQSLQDEAEIIELAVAANQRRGGVGDQLFAGVVTALQQAGVSHLLLEVASDNRAAIGLYEKHNLKEVGRRVGYYDRPDGGRIDALVMELWLSKSTIDATL